MTDDPNFEEISLFADTHEEPPEIEENPEPILSEPQKEAPAPTPTPTAETLWADKLWEFDITHPMQTIKDTIKEHMVEEGFTKREVNHIFKGLFFKEKVFNTKVQAIEYLKTIPTTYAVKYKIGIEPSPQMLSLEKRLTDKKEKLTQWEETQKRRWAGDFVNCAHCRSKINTSYLTPPTCPVCQEDVRPDTVLQKGETLQKNVKELQTRYERTARKYHAKFTGGEKWILRTVNSYKK